MYTQGGKYAVRRSPRRRRRKQSLLLRLFFFLFCAAVLFALLWGGLLSTVMFLDMFAGLGILEWLSGIMYQDSVMTGAVTVIIFFLFIYKEDNYFRLLPHSKES